MRPMHGYIALGSNLGDRRRHLEAGLAGLRGAEIRPLGLSSVWETEPVDSPSACWFWNMTVKVQTDRDALDVLDSLIGIEDLVGRERTVRNGPRTLDLDLLMLGDLVVDHERLNLPHPRMWQRRFVLAPLAEIEPDLVNPVTGLTVVEERDRSPDRSQVRRIGTLASCSTVAV
jgi:2-amino-4-hydroxy-6-hydroxymethyldihydropteridine diphosphokinase